MLPVKFIDRVIVAANTGWSCQKNSPVDQWPRAKGPEVNPYVHGRLILDSHAKTSHGATVVFSADGAGTTGTPHPKV